MKIKKADDVEAQAVEMAGAEGVTIRLLVHEADAAPNFYMRQFNIAPGGCTPRHVHPWEHEVYILSGSAAVWNGQEDQPATGGDCIFVPPGEEHQFTNAGDDELKMLCLVPKDSGPGGCCAPRAGPGARA